MAEGRGECTRLGVDRYGHRRSSAGGVRCRPRCGPRATRIFYRHEFSARDSYTVEAEVHLFDPGQRRESFGVFFGGRTLHDRDEQSYGYFLVRRDGSYMIRERAGAEVLDVQGWTEHDAVPSREDREAGAETVAYRLAVEVGPEDVVFRVNDTEVDRRSRSALPVDGHFGLRINHGLELHVSSVGVR